MVFSVPQERIADATRLKKLEGNDNFTWIGAALQQAAFWARAQEALLATSYHNVMATDYFSLMQRRLTAE